MSAPSFDDTVASVLIQQLQDRVCYLSHLAVRVSLHAGCTRLHTLGEPTAVWFVTRDVNTCPCCHLPCVATNKVNNI